MFTSSVTRYPYASKDSHRKITYGTPDTLTCRYAKMSKIITDQDGKDILAVAWTQFPAGTSVHPDDKIVLPDGTVSKIVKIHHINNHMGIEKFVDVYYGGESI